MRKDYPEWMEHAESGAHSVDGRPHRVIQIYPIRDGRCSCNLSTCTDPKSVGKHPVSRHWQQTSALSPEAIEKALESGIYDQVYGLIVDGLLVIDVDARNGGIESLEKLERDLGMSPGGLTMMAGYVVKTGSGGGSRHIYFEAPIGVSLSTNVPEYPGIDFKSSGYVIGAGSLHLSGNYYEILFGSPSDITPPPEALIEILRKPTTIRAVVGATVCDVAPADIEGALSMIPPDSEYPLWIQCGMAIHHATGGGQNGFEIWDKWSARGDKYPGPSQLLKFWGGFGKSLNPVTIGTLFHHALECGWAMPIHLKGNEIGFEPVNGTAGKVERLGGEDNEKGLALVDMPIDLAGVDVLSPPGFVGEVYRWIDSQCFFPRRRLAVAAALVAVGNAVGLRYEDDLTGATSNLFAFCVAGSASGKEGVGQAFSKLMAAARLSPAVHGGIKSTQEITRNLVSHQAAFYAIDELGIELTKIVNAQRKGTAAYLEAVIGELMKVYSKANGIYLVSGDVKAAVRGDILREIKALEGRQRPDAVDPQLEEAIEELRAKLAAMDLGLERPFLSLIGWTTPSTFAEVVTFEQVAAGFIGRALLVNEPDNNPPERDDVIPGPVPPQLTAALLQLAWGEVSGGRIARICERSPRRPIKTEEQAKAALKAVRRWIYRVLARQYQESNGMEAIVRRSYELIAKISLIVAAPSGLRTLEHVRYATAVALVDLDEKIRAVTAKEGNESARVEAAVLGVISETPVTFGTVANAYHLRKISRPLIQAALDSLTAKGMLIQGEEPDRRSRGKMVIVWSRPAS